MFVRSKSDRLRDAPPFRALLLAGFAAAGSIATADQPASAQSRTLSATGVLRPTATVVVGTRISGTVRELSCDVNEIVKKDQTCAQIDPRPYQMAVEAARAELATAIAQLEQYNASLAQARSDYERNSPLAERGIVTKVSLERMQSTYKQASAQADLARAVIEQRRAQLASAELNLGYTRILSPLDGVVLERRVAVGETLAASLQTPTLFVIASDLSRMHAAVRISEMDIGKFRTATKVSLSVKAFPKQKFAGTVAQIRNVPEAAGNVASYEVIISVDNIELYLRPGMSVAVDIELGE